MRKRAFFFALAGIIAAGVLSCGRPRVTRPNVLVILIDTLRADRLGVYGDRRGLTPFLDELAARGTTFANTYAASSWTCPSVASLFTSRYPSQHRTVTFEAKLAEREVTLAERLTQAGYVTGGFSANFRLTRALGYGQGFSEWRVYSGLDVRTPKVRAHFLHGEALAWLDGVLGKERPVFLYVHYMEPHSPYDPPQPYRSRFVKMGYSRAKVSAANELVTKFRFKKITRRQKELLSALYDGEVASVDAEIRALFAELERVGFLDNCIIVITADHGEEFGEHGMYSHGHTLFESAVRVPLIVIAPGFAEARVVEEPVSLVQVAPTILDLLGLPPEARFEGESLVPLMTPASWTERVRRRLRSSREGDRVPDLVVELEKTGSKYDTRTHSRGLIRWPHKLLVGRQGVPWLYDLSRDPEENAPAPARESELGAALTEALARREKELAARRNPGAETGEVDEATKERLRALGYDLR